MKKEISRQCQALTLPASYSPAHRCLKRNGVRKLGPSLLCAHHRAMAGRARG